MLHLEEVWDEEINTENEDTYEEPNVLINWEVRAILIFIVAWQFYQMLELQL